MMMITATTMLIMIMIIIVMMLQIRPSSPTLRTGKKQPHAMGVVGPALRGGCRTRGTGRWAPLVAPHLRVKQHLAVGDTCDKALVRKVRHRSAACVHDGALRVLVVGSLREDVAVEKPAGRVDIVLAEVASGVVG